jgi:hypothetical protein
MTFAATPMVLVLAAAAGLATAKADGTRTPPVVVGAIDGILAAFGSHVPQPGEPSVTQKLR